MSFLLRAGVGALSLCVLSALLWPPAARALGPDELAVLCRKGDEKSEKLAQFYATRRGLPPGRILALDVKDADAIGRADYDARIAEPTRNWLKENKLVDKVRCLLVVRPVPYQVRGGDIDPKVAELAAKLRPMLRPTQEQLWELAWQFEQMPDGRPSAKPPAPPQKIDEKDLLARLAKADEKAGKAVDAMASGAAKAKAAAELVRLRQLAQGRAAALAMLSAPPGTPAGDSLARLREQYEQDRKAINDLASSATIDDQLKRLELQTVNFGLVARLNAIQGHLRAAAMAQRSQSAAVDSELTLLWSVNYPLAGSQPNPMDWRRNGGRGANWPRPLMVSRLDGADYPRLERLIDDSIAAETAGLAGNVYLDLQVAKPQYRGYDNMIRELGDLVRKRTRLATTVEETARLFAPDSAPDCALYCGWYSLKKYVPAFTFKPGAVAWHIASFEAQQLRDPKATTWCPNLISAGAAATIGAVAEPYLGAFPRPNEYFALLLTGKYSLAEVYYLTLPQASWNMLAIGDPLYRPFAANPQLKAGDLPWFREPAWIRKE